MAEGLTEGHTGAVVTVEDITGVGDTDTMDYGRWLIDSYNEYFNMPLRTYNMVKDIYDSWDDYGRLQKYSTLPFIGSVFSNRMSQLAYDEQQRYNNDLAKNLYGSRYNPTYPIRSGVYGNFGRDPMFGVNDAIVNFYKKR